MGESEEKEIRIKLKSLVMPRSCVKVLKKYYGAVFSQFRNNKCESLQNILYTFKMPLPAIRPDG